MNNKLKPISIVLVFLLAVSAFLGYNVTISKGDVILGGFDFAEYEYYVVGGRNMTPTLPAPAPQPSGFTFTLEGFGENATDSWSVGTAGYDFGFLYYYGRDYLYDGNDESASPVNDNAYVVVNITNNLGYTITIEDLTAEVTNGTPWDPTDLFGTWFSNFTVLMVDTLDQWYLDLPKNHTGQVEEVDYYTGTVEVRRDPGYCDWAMGPNGAPRPPGNVGPYSLVEDDINGDAAATGHVATKYGGNPITLAPGATFTDYFGLTVWGAVPFGMQWDATVKLRLAYTVPETESVEEVAGVYLPDFYCFWPTYNDSTDQGYPEWSNLRLNGTVHNYGNVPINVRVDVYYIQVQSIFPLVPPPNAAWTHAMSQNVSIPVCNYTNAGFIWNFKDTLLGKGYWLVKANATATEQGGGLFALDDGFTCIFIARIVGDVDADADVDVGDQRKVQLAMFTSTGQPLYEEYNSYPIFTDMDGDGDVDVGDQRKQQLQMFKTQQDP